MLLLLLLFAAPVASCAHVYTYIHMHVHIHTYTYAYTRITDSCVPAILRMQYRDTKFATLGHDPAPQTATAIS